MPLEDIESAGKYITDLVVTNPESTDYPGQDGDNHLRGIKNVVVNSFPSVSGPVTATHTELSLLAGKTSVATLGGNIFTGEQNITSTASSFVSNSTSANAHFWLRDNGTARGVLYWDRTADATNLRQYDTDGATVRSQISLTELGVVNVTYGELQYGGTEVRTVQFRGANAKVSAAKAGINGSLTPLTNANSNIADLNDPNNWFNPTTGRMTPNIAGYYDIQVVIYASSLSIVPTLYLRKNGTNMVLDTGGTGTTLTRHVSVSLWMNGSTDYFDITISCADPSWTLEAESYFCINYLGS